MHKRSLYPPLGSRRGSSYQCGGIWLVVLVTSILCCCSYIYIYSSIVPSNSGGGPSSYSYLLKYFTDSSLDKFHIKNQISNLHSPERSSQHDLKLHARMTSDIDSEYGYNKVKPFDIFARLNLWDYFPPQVSCPDLQRLGRVGDGGKWICGINWLKLQGPLKQSSSSISSTLSTVASSLESSSSLPSSTFVSSQPSLSEAPCVVYSFGISFDASFEEEILMGTSCNVYAFDPSIGDLPIQPQFTSVDQWKKWRNTRLFFFKQALGTKSGPNNDHMFVESLYDIMDRLNHSYVDILKIDVEGYEWELFNHLTKLRNEKERTTHKSKKISSSSSSNIMKVINSNENLDLQWDDDDKMEEDDINPFKDPMVVFPFGQLLIELHYETMESAKSFFDLMRDLNHYPFSREINLQPCLEAKQPLASEYSFINPDLFFSDASKRKLMLYNPTNANSAGYFARSTAKYSSSFKSASNRNTSPLLSPKQQLLTPSWSKHRDGENALIYFLTQKVRVPMMKAALKALYDYFWLEYPFYPVIIFHDDLDKASMAALQSATPNMKLSFRFVNFTLPAHLKNVPERTVCAPLSSTIGYRHMCHFHATGVHKELNKVIQFRDVEYIMRLDDDGYFKGPVGYDLFKFMRVNNKKYAFPNILMDDPHCVKGLWNATAAFVNASLQDLSKNIFINVSNVFYNELKDKERTTFYNNFEISHVSIWKHPIWKRFIGMVEKSGGIFMHRWGDAPIHTLGASLVLKKTQIHAFSDIGYVHLPFVDQRPRGLPFPGQDPIMPQQSGCSYYNGWVCHNVSNSTSLVRGSGKDLIGYAALTRRSWVNKELSVIYSFGHGKREAILANTIISLFEKYAKQSNSYFVIFYSSKSDFDGKKFLGLVDRSISDFQIKLKLIEIDLGDHSLPKIQPNCNLGALVVGAEVRLAAEFMRFRAIDTLRRVEIPAPGSLVTFQNAPLRTTKQVLANFKSNPSRSFSWFIRIADDSKFMTPPKYNIVDRMIADGVKYGYINLIRENQPCSDVVWDISLAICDHLDSLQTKDMNKNASAVSKFPGAVKSSRPNDSGIKPNLGVCSKSIRAWPRGLVSFSNFEVSHSSVWTSTQCRVLRALAGSWRASRESTPEDVIVGAGEVDESYIRVLSEQISYLYKSGVANSLYWSDASVHTTCMAMTLTEKEIMRLEDFKYTFNWWSLNPNQNSSTLPSDDNNLNSMATPKLSTVSKSRLEVPYLNSIFTPRTVGWLGGDVACSFALPDLISSSTSSGGKKSNRHIDYLWLFGDSLIGTSSAKSRNNGHMVSNTVAHLRLSNSKVVHVSPAAASTPAILDIVASSSQSKSKSNSKASGNLGIPLRQVESLRFYWKESLPAPDSVGEVGVKPKLEAIFTFDALKLNNQNKAISLQKDVIFWPISGISIQPKAIQSAERVIVMGPVIQHFDASDTKSSAFSVGNAVAFEEKGVAVAVVTNPRDSADLWSYEYSLFPSMVAEYEVRWTALAADRGFEVCSFINDCEWNYFLGFYAPDKKVSGEDFSLSVRGSYQIIGRIKPQYLIELDLSQIEVLSEQVLPVTADQKGKSLLSAVVGDFNADLDRKDSLHDSSWQKLYKRSESSATTYRPFSIYPDRVTEASLHFNRAKGYWYTVSLQPPQDTVNHCRTASSAIEGPWTCKVIDLIGAPWDDTTNFITYAAKSHPEFLVDSVSSGNSSGVLFSLIANTLSGFSDLYSESTFNAYTPQFVFVEV